MALIGAGARNSFLRRPRKKAPAKGVVRRPAPAYKAPAAPPPAQYGQVAAPQAPTGPVAPPETVGAAGVRANTAQAWQGAQTGNRDAIWRAAMNLGDPAVLAQLQANPEYAGYSFAQDPNSLFSTLDRNQATGLKDIANARNAANTFFSGFRIADQDELRGDISRQRLGGVTDYQDNLREFAAALAAARGDFDLGMSQANQMDIDAAAAIEPEDEAGPASAPAPAPSKGKARNTNKARHKAQQARNKTTSAAKEAEAKARKKARKK